MKKVITVGVFDLFHFGHLRLFKNIKKQFNEDVFLTVYVQDSDYILKFKPDSKVMYSTEDRVSMIKELRCVDDVQVYKSIGEDIEHMDFDVWVKGPDQIHEGFQKAIKYCNEHGKEIITLPRTEFISSTLVKDIISEKLKP